ncbi:hypothetical protein [Arcobacter sp. CECT 9188]|uniref:hypothetical protein n=1 Tax=Arcobacter sp. CECT 9188 TaxID=2044505 RepID=UPI000DEB5E9B|nr:hypothetical protein [Arcobacter sp. CECT 9188]RBQ27616.1 hypothetical protein CRU88_02820 [Arcobacter sp. CECT 9188]
MKVKKSDEIIRIEEALKKAKLKQKEDIKKINLQFTDNILNKLKEDDNFKNDLKSLLAKYNLNSSIDLLNKNYGAFEIKQKAEEPKKEEN